MKLIQADQERFRFEMNPGEKQGLTRILKLYPLVPAAHHRLSKGHPIPHQEEGEQMLAEALKSQREENRQQVEVWLNEPRRFVECAGGYQIGLTRSEIEWLLPVLNDIRVGIWIALGSPEEPAEASQRLNRQTAPYFMIMDVAGYFESYFLEVLSGEQKIEPAVSAPAVLGKSLQFPQPEQADHEGLLAVGGDLSAERLLAAYRQGVFPWTINPITWWSPDPRGIIELENFHIPESLAKIIRQQPFKVTRDQAFRKVMQACAAPGPQRPNTWITKEFIEAYTRLHQQGHAHSVECWANGELVGGVYGVVIGGLFAGESMFHLADNASKVALCHLVQHLRERQFLLFDIQMVTAATRPLGAQSIPRAEYLQRLAQAVARHCLF